MSNALLLDKYQVQSHLHVDVSRSPCARAVHFSSTWLGPDRYPGPAVAIERLERLGALVDHHDAVCSQRNVPGPDGADVSAE